MQPFFSTDGIHPRNAVRQWRELVCERLVPAEIETPDGLPFQGRLDVTCIGAMPISHFWHTTVRTRITDAEARRRGNPDRVFVLLKLSGRDTIHQLDREAKTKPGDLILLDSSSSVMEAETGDSLVIDLPRQRFETVLGPSRLYTALTAAADLASTTLTGSYLQELVRVSDRLTPDAAERMASIGVDLIVASLAERMAQEVPRSIHGNVTVQRAKAYIEAHLGDPNLDPPRLAAAMGVSLRRLQELFHERGRHISDYIWGRRLEVAAKRLTDPACAALSIGLLAYGCGFSSQAHFARRFKDRYDVSPREYRQAHRPDVEVFASASGLSS
ncbi:MAG: helix-turn-helix domain-containing protein [Methylobacterium radiotolerans]